MNTESQNQMVLSHMTKHKTITSMDAFSLDGITRLSARIYDLRERGHKIGMVWEESVNRYGTQVRYGKYFIEKTKDKKCLLLEPKCGLGILQPTTTTRIRTK